MCAYCMVADWGYKWIPAPSLPIYPTNPFVPSPWTTLPGVVWTQEMLDEFRELLKRVKELEDKVDPCPCPDESKVAALDKIQEALDELKKHVKGE